jgi:hypothetical protein
MSTLYNYRLYGWFVNIIVMIIKATVSLSIKCLFAPSKYVLHDNAERIKWHSIKIIKIIAFVFLLRVGRVTVEKHFRQICDGALRVNEPRE